MIVEKKIVIHSDESEIRVGLDPDIDGCIEIRYHSADTSSDSDTTLTLSLEQARALRDVLKDNLLEWELTDKELNS